MITYEKKNYLLFLVLPSGSCSFLYADYDCSKRFWSYYSHLIRRTPGPTDEYFKLLLAVYTNYWSFFTKFLCPACGTKTNRISTVQPIYQVKGTSLHKKMPLWTLSLACRPVDFPSRTKFVNYDRSYTYWNVHYQVSWHLDNEHWLLKKKKKHDYLQNQKHLYISLIHWLTLF